MPLYIADYLADTAHLSAGEHGAYLLLIMHYWRVGKLPTDERQLSRIARMNTREWAASRETIAAFFDADWRHERIETELAKSASKSNARAQCGARGGSAKSLKNKEAALANAKILLEQNDSKALASSSQSHTYVSSLRSETPEAADAAPRTAPKKGGPTIEWLANLTGVHPVGQNFDISPIVKLFDAGKTLDEIETGIKTALKLGEPGMKWRRWSQFVGWVENVGKERPKRPEQPKPDTFDVNAANDREARMFRNSLDDWLKTGRWNPHCPSHAPDSPACFIPAAILAEFGLTVGQPRPVPQADRVPA